MVVTETEVYLCLCFDSAILFDLWNSQMKQNMQNVDEEFGKAKPQKKIS